MDYPYILRRAWQIAWRHKILWLFGFLASLGRLSQLRLDLRDMTLWLPPEMQQGVADFVYGPVFVPVVVVFLFLLLLASLGLMVLNAIGRAALINQINSVENGIRPDVRAGWEAGKRRARPVFGITLLLNLPIYTILAVGFVPYVIGAYTLYLPSAVPPEPDVVIAALGSFLACLLPAAFLALLSAIPLRILQRLAVCVCVLGQQPARESLRRAWAMLRRHLGAIALLWLILTAVIVGIVAVVGSPACLLTFGAVVPLAVLQAAFPYAGLVWFIGTAAFFWLLGVIVNGIVETFFSASWTVAYRDLTGLGRTGED